jgi:hypothetical protein
LVGGNICWKDDNRSWNSCCSVGCRDIQLRPKERVISASNTSQTADSAPPYDHFWALQFLQLAMNSDGEFATDSEVLIFIYAAHVFEGICACLHAYNWRTRNGRALRSVAAISGHDSIQFPRSWNLPRPYPAANYLRMSDWERRVRLDSVKSVRESVISRTSDLLLTRLRPQQTPQKGPIRPNAWIFNRQPKDVQHALTQGGAIRKGHGEHPILEHDTGVMLPWMDH